MLNRSAITVSTESAVFPKLLWEKKLSKPITSSAISSDGTKIAIADETGYLTVYNMYGGKIWAYHYEGKLPKRTYEFKSNKSDTAILNVSFSSTGKYIICDLGVLNTWNELHSFENVAKYEFHKKLCFNMEGKILWDTSWRGFHIIGGDKYVLIRELQDEDAETSIDYYVLDMTGKLIYTGKTIGHEGDCWGFSKDARYMFIDNKLIECVNWRLVWELKGTGGGIWKYLAIRDENVLVSTPEGLQVYNISTHKKLMDIEKSNFVSLTDNYVLGLVWKKPEGKYVLRVFDIKTGNIVFERQYKDKDIEWCSQLLLDATSDEKHLMLGSETKVLFWELESAKFWELPVEIEHCSLFDYYSVSGNGEELLIGYGKSVKLYKDF